MANPAKGKLSKPRPAYKAECEVLQATVERLNKELTKLRDTNVPEQELANVRVKAFDEGFAACRRLLGGGEYEN